MRFSQALITGLLGIVCLWLTMCAAAAGEGGPIAVVAAETVYGDVARQLGGDRVAVTSILSNPDQDPHLFEASPSTARGLAGAQIVIVNGAGYDAWIDGLLSVRSKGERRIVDAAKLLSRPDGANPHVWYDPATMPALARGLADDLAAIDPAHAAEYRQRRDDFLASLAPLDDEIRRLRQKYAGTAVTATEPLFGYMAEALGFEMRNQRFQLAVMNDTEPSARDIAQFEADLRSRAVRLLLYNSQTTNAMTARLLALAKASGVPVLGITETEPPGEIYQHWMMGQLDDIDRLLAGPAQQVGAP